MVIKKYLKNKLSNLLVAKLLKYPKAQVVAFKSNGNVHILSGRL